MTIKTAHPVEGASFFHPFDTVSENRTVRTILYPSELILSHAPPESLPFDTPFGRNLPDWELEIRKAV